MKRNLLLVVVVSFAFAKTLTAQTSPFMTEDVIGIYEKGGEGINVNIIPKSSIITWSLTLSPDGRFEYHNFRQLEGQEEEHWWAHGNWILRG